MTSASAAVRDLAEPVPAVPIGVMLLVSSLEPGGAERQVVELFGALDRRRFAPLICSLSDDLRLGRGVADPERNLVVVRKRWKYDVTTIPRVARVVRERRISIVHAFLFDAEMTARLARRLGLVPVVIASERNSEYSLGRLKRFALRSTSGWFEAMIANSAAGKQFNVDEIGIAPDRIHVVRNGIDTSRFARKDGRATRLALGIPLEAPLVGMIASFKRQKRHEDFFAAARLVLERIPDAWFMCVGEPLGNNQQGAEDYHREIRQLVDRLRLSGRVVFAGAQQDMPSVYSACDVTALTSFREGTPNVLLESMACGIPVVATSAGDNRVIVPDGDAGFIVERYDVESVADRLVMLLTDPVRRARMGAAGRTWVVQEFSKAALARRTEAVYLQALATRHGASRRPAALEVP
jgi:glycosyltransferase involved in cell wall biosynthesis